MIRARVRGTKRLNRKLRSLPAAMERELDAAREKSAVELVALQRQLAPIKSGELRESIDYRRIDTPTDRTKRGAIMVFAGTDESGWYAPFVEFGTRTASATPFFFPAYRLLKRRIGNRIKRAAGRGARKAFGR